jgi:hypothetical protein
VTAGPPAGGCGADCVAAAARAGAPAAQEAAGQVAAHKRQVPVPLPPAAGVPLDLRSSSGDLAPLEAWAAQAENSPVSELRGFSKGLRKDWAAVTAGLTVSYSSGAVEGHVNRIKMIKRQMYGRAKPDLLRKRVLLAD